MVAADGQRQFGPVEHGARGQPDLALAAVALVDRPALELGIAPVRAARARPAFAPAQRKQRRPALRLGPEPLSELALAQTLDPPPNPTLRTHPLTPPRPTPAWMLARGRLGVTDNQDFNYGLVTRNSIVAGNTAEGSTNSDVAGGSMPTMG